MRGLLWVSLLSVLTLFPNSGSAGDRLPQVEVLKRERPRTVNPTEETYRGYISHLSEIAGRKDFDEIVIAPSTRHCRECGIEPARAELLPLSTDRSGGTGVLGK